ncbi:hypothetical protein Y032_0190g1255 [Ancylostoma ceylanicum]|uniref:Uncharacterized protein n=1 Tax=Ancylostoma ceylanicum TaxID=53326 RepID=A0A016SPZ8_9BILA|nr:hypothetical protein Y032_0190g1255 [Ancylostoma ceylanicum]
MPVYLKIRAEPVLLQALTAVLLAEFPHINLTNFRQNQLNPISSRSWQNSGTINLTTKFEQDPSSTGGAVDRSQRSEWLSNQSAGPRYEVRFAHLTFYEVPLALSQAPAEV